MNLNTDLTFLYLLIQINILICITHNQITISRFLRTSNKININTIVSDIKYKLHQTNYVDSTKSTPVVISFTNNIDTGHIVTPYYPFIPDQYDTRSSFQTITIWPNAHTPSLANQQKRTIKHSKFKNYTINQQLFIGIKIQPK